MKQKKILNIFFIQCFHLIFKINVKNYIKESNDWFYFEENIETKIKHIERKIENMKLYLYIYLIVLNFFQFSFLYII